MLSLSSWLVGSASIMGGGGGVEEEGDFRLLSRRRTNGERRPGNMDRDALLDI